MSTHATIVAVLVDGSEPDTGLLPNVPYEQEIVISQGEDMTVPVRFINTKGDPVNLTGTSTSFAAAPMPIDCNTPGYVAPISRQLVIDNGAAGLGHITLVPSDSIGLVRPPQFRWSLRFTAANPNNTASVLVPLSLLTVTPCAVAPGAPVTVPPSDAPLGQGPAGPPGPAPVPTAVKTADYTAAYGELVRVDPTAGTFNVTLPAASSAGKLVAVYNVSASANGVTLVPAGADTVGGAASLLFFEPRGVVWLEADGVSDWMVHA